MRYKIVSLLNKAQFIDTSPWSAPPFHQNGGNNVCLNRWPLRVLQLIAPPELTDLERYYRSMIATRLRAGVTQDEEISQWSNTLEAELLRQLEILMSPNEFQSVRKISSKVELFTPHARPMLLPTVWHVDDSVCDLTHDHPTTENIRLLFNVGGMGTEFLKRHNVNIQLPPDHCGLSLDDYLEPYFVVEDIFRLPSWAVAIFETSQIHRAPSDLPDREEIRYLYSAVYVPDHRDPALWL